MVPRKSHGISTVLVGSRVLSALKNNLAEKCHPHRCLHTPTHTRMRDFKTSGKLSPNGSAWTSSSKVMTICVTKKNVKPHRAYTGSMPSAFCLPPAQNRHPIRCEGGYTDRAERMAIFLLIHSIHRRIWGAAYDTDTHFDGVDFSAVEPSPETSPCDKPLVVEYHSIRK